MPRQPRRPSESTSGSLEADDLASYIAGMSGELAALADRAGWPTVAYFLQMASIQAQACLPPAQQSRSQKRGVRASPSRRRKVA